MKNDEIGMYKILQNFLNRDIHSLKENLIETNKLIVSLTNSFYEDKILIPHWKINIEILLLKYSFHSSSFVKLLEGTSVSDYNNETKIFQDVPSLRIIVRANIENYLTLKYLFFDPKSDEEGEFRYYLYQFSGLISRQKFGNIPEEFRKQSEDELEEIKNLENLIRENLYFKNLTPKRQKEILSKKSAREYGWEQMIENSDIKSEIFKPIWKLFSNTAHSELIGAIQFKGFLTLPFKHLEEELCLNIFASTLINASLISSIQENYPNTKKIFENISDEFNGQIIMWTNLSRKKNVS